MGLELYTMSWDEASSGWKYFARIETARIPRTGRWISDFQHRITLSLSGLQTA